jgi:hypothetical protein
MNPNQPGGMILNSNNTFPMSTNQDWRRLLYPHTSQTKPTPTPHLVPTRLVSDRPHRRSRLHRATRRCRSIPSSPRCTGRCRASSLKPSPNNDSHINHRLYSIFSSSSTVFIDLSIPRVSSMYSILLAFVQHIRTQFETEYLCVFCCKWRLVDEAAMSLETLLWAVWEYLS